MNSLRSAAATTTRRAACDRRRLRRFAAIVAATAIAALTAAPAQAQAQKPGKLLQPTPPGQIMVVSANLKASFNNKYIRSSGGRMRLLSSRLLSHIQRSGGLYRPDVVLLQEALDRQLAPGDGVKDDLSATRVASELTQLTGDPYAIVVNPGKRQRPSKGVSKETAIVANLETMQWPEGAGFVASNALKRKLKFKHTGPKGGGRAPSRRQAWAVIKERGPDGVTFPVASVHFLTDKRLGCSKGAKCQRRVNRLKVFWTKQVGEVLRVSAPDSFHRAIIGGDFNTTRKDSTFGGINRLGYRKAIRGRIDYIFTRGSRGKSGIDDSHHTGRGAYPLGYSDHRFLWATVG
jgi:Endonuclease/Exonuclease/phosphatase family